MSGEGEAASWAREELAGLIEIPEYGTRRWHELEPLDPRRQAAVIVAAERWRESQGASL